MLTKINIVNNNNKNNVVKLLITIRIMLTKLIITLLT